MKRWISIALLALMPLVSVGFPTNESKAYINIEEAEGSFDQFRFKWIGQSDQRIWMNISNSTQSIDMSGYVPNFRVTRNGTVYVDVLGTNININSNIIDFAVSRTNIPPDADYQAELWVYEGSNTNLANVFAQGKVTTSRSLYQDTNYFPFPATPTNFAEYLTIDQAASTYATKAESYTNFVLTESTSNGVAFTAPTVTYFINTNVQAGDITSVTVSGGFLSGGTNTGDAVITLTTNSIDAVFASDTELSTATNLNFGNLTTNYTAADVVATNAAVTTANAYTDSATNNVDLHGVLKAGNVASTNLDMNGFTIGDTQGEGIYISSSNGRVGINTREPAQLPTFASPGFLTVKADGARDPSIIIEDGTTTSKTKSLAYHDVGTTNWWSLEMEAGAPYSLEFWYYRGATAAWQKMLEFQTNGTLTASTNFTVDGLTTLGDLSAEDITASGNTTIASNIFVNGHIRGDGLTDMTGMDAITARNGVFSNSLKQGAIDVVLETRQILGGTGITIGDGYLSNNVTVNLDTTYTDDRYVISGTNVFQELIVADINTYDDNIVVNGSFTNGLNAWVNTNFTYNAAISNVTLLVGNSGTLIPSSALSIRDDSIYRVSYVVDVNNSAEEITVSLGGATNTFSRDDATGDIIYTNAFVLAARNSDNLKLVATATSNSITMDDIEVREIMGGDMFAFDMHVSHELTVGGTNIFTIVGSDTTNASSISADFTPTNYTAGGDDVSSHLQGIDVEIGVQAANDTAISNIADTAQTTADAAQADATAALQTSAVYQVNIDGLLSTQATQQASIDANSADIDALFTTQGTQQVSIDGFTSDISALFTTQAVHTVNIDALLTTQEIQQVDIDLIEADVEALFTTQAVNSAAIDRATNTVVVMAENNASQVINSLGFNQILFQNEVIDNLGTFSSHQFTAPRDGLYRVSPKIIVRADPNKTCQIRIAIVVNGTRKQSCASSASWQATAPLAYDTLTMTPIISLQKNDVVKIEVWSSGPDYEYSVVGFPFTGNPSMFSSLTINSL